MKRCATDTHCLLWFMAKDRRLPHAAQRALREAKENRAQILVPSIVLVEAIFLTQRQRVSEELLSQLMTLTEEPDASICVVPLDMAVVRAAKDLVHWELP